MLALQPLERAARLIAEEEIPAPRRRLLEPRRALASGREEVDDEAHKVPPARLAVERGLDGRVRDEPAIAKEPAVDLDRREVRHETAACERVLRADLRSAPRVEHHFVARLDVGRHYRHPRRAAVEPRA